LIKDYILIDVPPQTPFFPLSTSFCRSTIFGSSYLELEEVRSPPGKRGILGVYGAPKFVTIADTNTSFSIFSGIICGTEEFISGELAPTSLLFHDRSESALMLWDMKFQELEILEALKRASQ